jgi:hypothetical protein
MTGNASSGRGGSISLVVGATGSGLAGGRLVLSAGTSVTTGGNIYLTPGAGGTSSPSGSVVVSGPVCHRTLFVAGATTEVLTGYDIILLSSVAGSCPTTYTLVDGQAGQSIVFVYAKNTAAPCTLNVAVNNGLGFTKVVFTSAAPAAPDAVTLVWNGSKWMVTMKSGSVVVSP